MDDVLGTDGDILGTDGDILGTDGHGFLKKDTAWLRDG